MKQGIRGWVVFWAAFVLLVVNIFTIWDQGRVIQQQQDLIVQMVTTNPACTEPTR